MKKIIFWTALISILGLLIGACSKRSAEDATTAFVESCDDTTASGSITIGSDTASGTYLHLTSNESYNSLPATGCNQGGDYSTDPTMPTGTQSVLKKKIITSSTSFVDHVSYYSDTACTSRLGYLEKRYSNLSVGDTVSGLDNSSGGRPTSGYRVTYKPECAKIMADTDAAMVTFNTAYAAFFQIYPMTTGTEKAFCETWACQVQTYYSIWGAGDNGTTFSIYQAMGGSAGYEPSDWDDNSGGATYQK
jgi:hypothetical protein